MAKIKTKGKQQKETEEEQDVFDQDPEELEQDDTPIEELEEPDLTEEQLKEDDLDIDISPDDLASDIDNIAGEDPVIQTVSLEEADTEKEDHDIDEDEIDVNTNSQVITNTVKICPFCNEEVLVMDSQICPLCGNPLGITADGEMKESSLDDDSLLTDYFSDDEKVDVDYDLEKHFDKNGRDDLFSDLPYQDSDR